MVTITSDLVHSVVEGVCTQTISVAKQAWDEGLKPILVLNKLDRLITELQYSAEEALNRILEQMNALMGTFFNEDLMFRNDELYEYTFNFLNLGS